MSERASAWCWSCASRPSSPSRSPSWSRASRTPPRVSPSAPRSKSMGGPSSPSRGKSSLWPALLCEACRRTRRWTRWLAMSTRGMRMMVWVAVPARNVKSLVALARGSLDISGSLPLRRSSETMSTFAEAPRPVKLCRIFRLAAGVADISGRDRPARSWLALASDPIRCRSGTRARRYPCGVLATRPTRPADALRGTPDTLAGRPTRLGVDPP